MLDDGIGDAGTWRVECGVAIIPRRHLSFVFEPDLEAPSKW